jgi:hypothetical protein
MDTDKDVTAAANVDVTSALNVTGTSHFTGEAILNGKLKQKGAFLQSSTHQSLFLGV